MPTALLPLPPASTQLYDGRVRRSRHPGRYPRILFLVTGRGPQRAAYEERMRGLDLRHVAFRWGEAGLGGGLGLWVMDGAEQRWGRRLAQPAPS